MARIKKLLIANRGEIAVRIIRSARTMGIRTVAIYSDADAGAAHAAMAAEACRIGPPEPSASYLNISAILEAARATGADAIHPGYGFLSERPEFARAVSAAGLIFVGPPAEVMAAVGDKLAARRLALGAGVPVVPGIETADLDSARSFGAKAGFPILVKAAAGGGGRGMRVVESARDLEAALEAASREAASAFGDGRVFLEKYLARPRHIEVQILGDHHGEVIALGERECSLQRRHQKLIEESPAPGLSDQLHAALIEAALRLARAAGYCNAGTAEFLVDGDEFYFLEVNARLQVEHPVTEIRFGRDLVCDQLEIAAGEHVTPAAAPTAHAIECRINAEDAAHHFRPATGTVLRLTIPAGPGVRVDTHLAAGAEISSYYDSLLAKVICWGESREQARQRMLGALDEFSLLGVHHSAAFLRDVIASEPFASAELSTRFIPDHFPAWHPHEDQLKAALIAAALQGDGRSELTADRAAPVADGARAARSPWTQLGQFEPWSRR
ncbi:MAG TPA: biotin carboxylase N-terminal domain-containing protein [Candidatus Binataceae bacterium]|nr:biotin carboxylase N-terminal domain-containing protein [Candidatus Binataceae bacterium]